MLIQIKIGIHKNLSRCFSFVFLLLQLCVLHKNLFGAAVGYAENFTPAYNNLGFIPGIFCYSCRLST